MRDVEAQLEATMHCFHQGIVNMERGMREGS